MNSAVKDAAQEEFEGLRETVSDCCEQGEPKCSTRSARWGNSSGTAHQVGVGGVGVGVLLGTF